MLNSNFFSFVWHVLQLGDKDFGLLNVLNHFKLALLINLWLYGTSRMPEIIKTK